RPPPPVPPPGSPPAAPGGTAGAPNGASPVPRLVLSPVGPRRGQSLLPRRPGLGYLRERAYPPAPVRIDPPQPASLDWYSGPNSILGPDLAPKSHAEAWEIMSTDIAADVSFWEKLGDGLSAFSEGVGKFLMRLMGSSNERYVRKLGYIRASKPGATHTVIPGSLLAQVNDLEDQMQALSDEEMKGLAARWRDRLAKGATLDDLLPEVFAATREAGRRTKNMRHFDVQILGGVVLHRGNIAEMVTGEGKTLVATLPAYLNALEQKGVHVVTVNDYLARRDCEWMSPIYRAVGVNAGFIQSDMDPDARRLAYECDITYGTNSEFGFDYLRDNMKPARPRDKGYAPWQRQVQPVPLNYAIIDEVDNILIDEARPPLIISGQAFTDVRRYDKANYIAVQLGELQKSHPGKYFEVKEKEH